MDYLKIIDKYYKEEDELRQLILLHSRMVADMSLTLGRRLLARGTDVDMRFVEEGAMLHDIGIFLCDAPSIHCHGTDPYIRHGVLGAELLRREGFPRHARICERHTGTGLTPDNIRRQHLPLPAEDMLPETIEEKLICYADKFYSKSGDPAVRKTRERAEASMARHGADSLARFRELEELLDPQ